MTKYDGEAKAEAATLLLPFVDASTRLDETD
jgi:hypothetical protein